MPDLVIAGAGMAGLVAAAHARARGARVVVHEKGDRLGGSMRLSSGVIWRYRQLARFQQECPGGDEALQRLIHERLDGDLRWLIELGARVHQPTSGNPDTTGVQFDTSSLTTTLAARAGEIRSGQPLLELPDRVPVILATGGFPASRELVREHITPHADSMIVRANRWSTGDGLHLGIVAGADTTDALGEFYGRAMPAPPAIVGETDFVSLTQLYAQHAAIEGPGGDRFVSRTWSEIDVVQWMAQQRDARARFLVPVRQLATRVRNRTVGQMIDAAEVAGASVSRTNDTVTIDVVAGITSTLGGLRADTNAQVAPAVFSAGSDVGGIATGGYASGLAAALVFGRIAADAALGVG